MSEEPRKTGPDPAEPAEARFTPRSAFRGRGGLGRGLGALIPETPPAESQSAASDSAAAQQASDSAGEHAAGRLPGPATIDIDLVAPNPRQPRTAMDPEQLATLSESIRQHGLLQPLVVSRQQTPAGGTSYVLIAGERRLHAARAAGLRRVPAVIREVTPQEQLELALVENIQRADLNPLEEAAAFQRLAIEFGLTQEALAQRVGRGRVAVANTLRLLGLSDELKASLAHGEISEGHARALLGLPDTDEQRRVWQQVVERGLSVRETEALVRALRDAAERPAEKREPATPVRRDPDLDAVIERLQVSLGTAVQIERGRKGGRLVINFYSDEELDGLVQTLLGPEASL